MEWRDISRDLISIVVTQVNQAYNTLPKKLKLIQALKQWFFLKLENVKLMKVIFQQLRKNNIFKFTKLMTNLWQINKLKWSLTNKNIIISLVVIIRLKKQDK